MKDKDKYTERDLEELGSLFSGEIDVDKAWHKLYDRIGENSLQSKTVHMGERQRLLFRIAAAALIIIGLGSTFLYLKYSGALSNRITVTSAVDQRNVEVSLPDGSKVWLNRSSQLSYDPDLGTASRNVRLKGEAFFDITHDASKPFIIDAGKARIKVIGTSFNVITNNTNNEVEVLVQTGRVLLFKSSGEESVIIEPGYVGTTGTKAAGRSLNENRNYLSWKTDTLVYDGQTLDVVFSDLKRVFNINITADDPSITSKSLTTTFFSLPHDTIIQLICNTFNFSYTKDGTVYHLSK